MAKKIQNLLIKGRTDTCPSCAYSDGFQISFIDTLDKLKIILICPECHARFDPAWEIPRSVLHKIK